MGGHYKDVGEIYAYQIPLESEGYRKYDAFTYNEYPKDFVFPDSDNGWVMRRAIKNWIEEHPNIFKGYYWKIVRANGYWRDLHGDYVYEVWVKDKVQQN